MNIYLARNQLKPKGLPDQFIQAGHPGCLEDAPAPHALLTPPAAPGHVSSRWMSYSSAKGYTAHGSADFFVKVLAFIPLANVR